MTQIKITFTNNCDTQNVMYQLGYTQDLYLLGVFDSPIIERSEQISENGFGEREVNFSRSAEVWRFVTTHVSDTQLLTLTSIRDHDTITVQRFDTTYYEEMTISNFNATYADQKDGCFNVATMTFEVDSIVHESCCNNKDLIACP